jgi:hypothetical protein
MPLPHLLNIIQQTEYSNHMEQEESFTFFEHLVVSLEFCSEQQKFLKTEINQEDYFISKS